MSPDRARAKRLLTACLLLVCVCRLAPVQTNAQTNTLTNAQGDARNDARGVALLARVEKSVEEGRIEEVEKTLLDYAVAHPKDARALDLLGRVRYRQGRLEEARALYGRVLTLDPTLTKTRINLGRLMYDSGQREEARRLLVEVARIPSADADIRLSLAKALLLVGEYRTALAVADRLPVKTKSTEALPVIAAIYLALNERQTLSALIPSMKRASASIPTVAVQCAEVLRDAGMPEQAVNLLRSALGAAPNNADVLLMLGRLETEARDFAQARRHLERAAALDALSADALSALAALESAEGNPSAALASLERARVLAPDSPTLLAQFVLTAMRANRPRAASDAAAELLKLKPDEPEFLYLFGAAALQSGNLASAQKALERYTAERPEDSRGCLALGITFAAGRERPEAARAQFEKCLALDAANVEAKYQLALVFKSQGETAKAIPLLEDVAARAPRHAAALRDLGALYLQTNSDARARAALERAVALDAEDAETHFQLSRLYSRAGESALAERHLALFQKLKSAKEGGGVP
jgi:tetratricopeptide (TPR) repeat protein